jgi:hypothetical protein
VCSAFARRARESFFNYSRCEVEEQSENVTFLTKRHNPTTRNCSVFFRQDTRAKQEKASSNAPSKKDSMFCFQAWRNEPEKKRKMKNHFSERNKKRISYSECISFSLIAILSTRSTSVCEATGKVDALDPKQSFARKSPTHTQPSHEPCRKKKVSWSLSEACIVR